MSKKQTIRKNAGGGAGPLPLRRSYEREAVEQRGKYPDPREVRPQDRTTSKEAMKLTTKTKPSEADYDLAQWRRAALITLSTDEAELANRDNYLLPIRNPDGSLSFDLLAEAERELYSGQPKNVPLEKRREAAGIIARIAGGEGRMAPHAVEASEDEGNLESMDNDRMRLAQSLNERADEIMGSQNVSFTEAVKLAGQEQDEEITLADVEAYAEKHGIEPDGDAFRALQMDRLVRAQSHGVPGAATSTVDEEAEIRRVAQERGYGDL